MAWIYRRRGLPVLVTAEFNHWRKVLDADGVEGWLHKTLLSGKRTAVVTGEASNFHLTGDDDAPIVCRAEASVIGALEAAFLEVMRLGPMPLIYAKMLAATRLRAGQPQQVLEVLDAALDLVEEPSVGAHLSELHRATRRCRALLRPNELDAEIKALEEAVRIARLQHATFFELCAAIDLAQVWVEAGDPYRGARPLRCAVEAASSVGDTSQYLTQAQRLLLDLTS